MLAEGRRGFEVAPVSGENLKELVELRLLLETHAMGVLFANADVEWEGRVVSAHHKLALTDRLMENGLGELKKGKRYDGEFHQALISNCGSRTLMESTPWCSKKISDTRWSRSAIAAASPPNSTRLCPKRR